MSLEDERMKRYIQCNKEISKDTVKVCIFICRNEIDNITERWSSNLSNNLEKKLYRVDKHLAVIYGVNAINGNVQCNHSELNEIAAHSLHGYYRTYQLSIYQNNKGEVIVYPDNRDVPEITDVLKQYFK